MNRLAMGLLLAAITLSGTAAAEWVRVHESDLAIVYADPTTIRRVGNTVRMWSLGNFKSAQNIRGTLFLSQKILDEHDCKDKRHRMLYLSQHSGQMGSGEIVSAYSGDPGAWQAVPAGSTGEALWEFACGKTFAAGEWVQVAETDLAVVYADSTTIRRTGDRVRMWELSDFKTAQNSPIDNQPFLSLRTQMEYDCQGKRTRSLHISAHSGQMGGGEIIYSGSGPGDWKPFTPTSVNEAVWKAVCGGK